MENDTKPIRIAFYIRVSTEDQLKGNGIELQKRALMQLYKQKSESMPRWTLNEKKHVYVDKAMSGAKQNRPQFLAMMEAVKKKEIDLVVVWKIDRLSRSLQQLLVVFEELKKYKASFYSLKENIDFTGAIGKLTFHIFGALAEFERSMISMRTNEGKISSALRGNTISGQVPYGFTRIRNEGKSKKGTNFTG